MTNKFHLTLDSIGTRIVALAMFLYLATNTWHFIGTFIPADTIWHQPVMFVFFEGGLLYWFNRLEHASENVAKTIIAAFMTLVQLCAVMFATVYELSLGLQQKMHINIDSGIVNALPFVVTGLIMLWIVAWALGRMANEHFGNRIKHIAKYGVSPHVDVVRQPQSRYVTGSLDRSSNRSSTKQLAGAKSNLKALPAPSTENALPVPRSVNLLQRLGAWFGGDNRIEVDESDATPEADEEDIRERQPDEDKELAEAQYDVVPRTRQPRAHVRSTSNPTRARRSPAQINRILSALDKAEPGQSDAALARQAGCSTSTVSRWRKQ